MILNNIDYFGKIIRRLLLKIKYYTVVMRHAQVCNYCHGEIYPVTVLSVMKTLDLAPLMRG